MKINIDLKTVVLVLGLPAAAAAAITTMAAYNPFAWAEDVKELSEEVWRDNVAELKKEMRFTGNELYKCKEANQDCGYWEIQLDEIEDELDAAKRKLQEVRQ